MLSSHHSMSPKELWTEGAAKEAKFKKSSQGQLRLSHNSLSGFLNRDILKIHMINNEIDNYND